MHAVELTLALLVAVAFLGMLARFVRIPYPILLVLGGLLLALSPAVPSVVLEPDLVFLLFLPPILYLAAFNTAIKDVRAEFRPILSLAVGLVLATTAAVAVVAHAILPQIGWPAAFALGAIVSPPDAVAAAAILRRLHVPRRIVTVLEGESLFNDATALVAYRVAVTAMATATFSLPQAGVQFVLVAVGGVVVGLGVAALIAGLRRRLHDPPVEITVSLLTPFAAYLAAEQLGVSGVLATVTAGLGIGWWAPRIMNPETRMRGRAVWDMVLFVLNGLIFLLIGLQLSTILVALSSHSPLAVVGYGLLISLTVILVRLAWIVPAELFWQWLGCPVRWSEVAVIGWAGMRGVVSLATALALPHTTPERDLLLFLVFCVILATLVGQGLTLPWLIQRLGVAATGAEEAEQEQRARALALAAAQARIEQLVPEWPTHLPLIEALRTQYAHRASHFGEHHAEAAGSAVSVDGAGADGAASRLSAAEQELLEHRQIRRAVIDAERDVVLGLRDRGEIDDEVWRRIERDLDLEEMRLEA